MRDKFVKMSRVFVTVGTTEFDQLIETVTNRKILYLLKNLGYNEITLQIGNSKLNAKDIINRSTLKMEIYKFKDSILEDINDADLVISHAGAGTCIEVLNAKKPLLVVVNEQLMGNHQIELARALYEEGCLHYCTCGTIAEGLRNNFKAIKPAPEANPKVFVKYLDNLMS